MIEASNGRFQVEVDGEASASSRVASTWPFRRCHSRASVTPQAFAAFFDGHLMHQDEGKGLELLGEAAGLALPRRPNPPRASARLAPAARQATCHVAVVLHGMEVLPSHPSVGS